MFLRGYPLAVWAAVSCLGYGVGLSRLLSIQGNLGDAGVLGLFCLAVLSCGLHFFTALSPGVQIAVLGTGSVLALVFHQEMARRFQLRKIAVAAGLSAFFHKQAVTMVDSGLYHLQTVEWNTQFPITWGLGNLHGRLAFNSSLFAMAPLDDRIALGWITNLLVLMFVLISCCTRIFEVRRGSVGHWFLGLTICVLAICPTLFWWAGVLNADAVSAILVLYWFAVALSAEVDHGTNIALLLLTGGLALTIKVSAAPLLFFGAVGVWYFKADVRPFRAIAAACVLLVLWLARGIALSGCAVYPILPTCMFSLPWSVTREQTAIEALSIKSWARAPWRFDYANVLANWDWIANWGARMLQAQVVRLFLHGLVIGSVAVVAGARLSKLEKSVSGALGIGLMYWFLTAPDSRFGAGFLVAVGIGGLSVAGAAWIRNADFLPTLALEVVAVSMLIGATGVVRDDTAWSEPNRPVYELKRSAGEKAIWVPTGESQSCWDHELPCTPVYRTDRLKRVQWR